MHSTRAPCNVTLHHLLAGTRVTLHYQPAAPLEDRSKYPTTDDEVQDAVVGSQPLPLTEGQVVGTEHIEDPPRVKGSWSVVVPQVEGNGGVGLRVFLINPHR